MDIFNTIEIYEYETKDKSYIKIDNLDGTEFLYLEGKNINTLIVNTKTGNIIIKGAILGDPAEKLFLEWKRNSNELIKKIEIVIVKGGHARHYILNGGIQTTHEDYSIMEFMVMLKHDTRTNMMFSAVKPLSYGLHTEIIIDKNEIINNKVSSQALLNLGLSTLALTLAIPSAGGSLSIPVLVTLLISGAAYISATLEFSFELTGDFEEYQGKTDLLQQLAGEIGKGIGKILGDQGYERAAEGMYDKGVQMLGIVSGVKSLKSLTNPNNYRKIAKAFSRGNSYIGVKKIRLKGSKIFQGLEGGKRVVNKSRLTSDVINAVGASEEVRGAIKQIK